jgi:hypothetical protein
MKLRIEIDCDNAAFEPSPNADLARILRRLATDIERGDMDVCRADGSWSRPLMDWNGNKVGVARFADAPAPAPASSGPSSDTSISQRAKRLRRY